MKPAKKFALLLLALSLGVVLTASSVWYLREGPLQRSALQRREIALRVLGEYLATEFPGKNALIVSNPFSQRPNQPSDVYNFEKAGIRGLKEGWENKIHVRGIAFPELNPVAIAHPSTAVIDPQTTTPLSFLTAENAWESMLAKNPGVDLVVSLIGLPANLRNLEFWRQPNPKVALLFPDLRMIGNWSDVRQALRSGKLAAMVVEKPGAPPETVPIGRDYRVEFEKRFALITARNFDLLAGGPNR